MKQSSNIQVPTNFIPRDYQLPVLQALDGNEAEGVKPYKRALLRWPRRAGKDTICYIYMAKSAVKRPGNYFYIFPSATQAKKAVWEKIDESGFRTLFHLPRELMSKEPNKQEMVIYLKNGSTIRFVGSDRDPDILRGVSCCGAVFSEFAYQESTEMFRALTPSLRETGGWAILNSTPNGKNHFYQMEQRARESSNWYVNVLQTMWPDKENYIKIKTKEELAEIQVDDGHSEEDMAREYGVSYETGIAGAFYAHHVEQALQTGRVGNFPYNDNNWVDTFWDIGYKDDTVVWFRQIDGDRIVFVDYFEDRQKDIAYYIQMLLNKGYRYRTHYLPHDGAQTSIQTDKSTKQLFYEGCKKAGISSDIQVVSRPRRKLDAINLVRSRFSRYYFDESTCAVGLEKLALYHQKYDKARQVFMKEPEHDKTSHCADAMSTEALAGEPVEWFERLNLVKDLPDFDPLDF